MNPRTGILIILDGFGINPDPTNNAIAQANCPTYLRLLRDYPHTKLEASESFVGLPSGFMGNSEVGHLNIGAGRVVYQDFSLISKAIEDGSFFTNPVLLNLLYPLSQSGKALHVMGLASDGGVHSHISHLFAILKLAELQKISRVWIHAFTDGRDTNPMSGLSFIRQIQELLVKFPFAQIATVQGRFYAMDRDKRWDRTELAYKAIVGAEGERFADPLSGVQSSYDRKVTDEFILPLVSENYSGVADGDGVLFFNFRADRARQITRSLSQADFVDFPRKTIPKLSGYVCMTPYDESLRLPTAYGKPKVPQTLGEIISKQGWPQLRIAETEKYAHVTYFFNGGDEKVFEKEERLLIPSPRDVKTYDLKPEMSAVAVCDRLVKELEQNKFKFVVVNFANPDMVGHTGNLLAAIRAVETVDICLTKIINWVESNDGFAILTADHGNCEQMQDPKGDPLTSHTLMPVPFILIDPKNKKASLREGSLCDIAPTMLKCWNLPIPPEMTGKSLL